MTHAVENMAYAGEVPWHGLGFNVKPDLSPEQMLKAAKLDWEVEKRPLWTLDEKGKKIVSCKDNFALVRCTDNSVLSVVGRGFKPVQNADAMAFFKKFVDEGKMQLEVAGSLWYGRYMWALAKVGKEFYVGTGKKDAVQPYLLLMSPHTLGKSMVIQFTPIRVVCWNTLSWALGSNLKGDGSGFRMPHSQEFDDDVKARAEEALGLATEQVEEFQEAVTTLSKKNVSTADLDDFFNSVMQFDPNAANRNKDGSVREPKMIPMFRDALVKAPGAELPGSKGTWWGGLNAVSYVIDHEIGRDRGATMKTAWFGNKAAVKRRAVKIALNMAS